MELTIHLILLLVSILLIAASVFVYFGHLKISNELFERLAGEPQVENTDLPDSPYKIVREYSSYHSRDEFYIYKGRNQESSQRFYSAKTAQTSMNELEKIGGFKLTKVV